MFPIAASSIYWLIVAWTEFINSSASTTRNDLDRKAHLYNQYLYKCGSEVHRTGKLSHPFSDHIDSMIRKSIKLLFIKIRVPAATLQNVDRSTMSSASIQSQSPRSFVNNVACQPRLSRMSIGRPCRLRQSRVKAHDLLLTILRASRDSPECRSVDHVVCVNPESKPTIFC